MSRMSGPWAFLLLLSSLALGAPAEPTRELRVVMGTLAEIQISGVEGGRSGEALIAEAFTRIEEVEAALSVWVDSSEIAALNRNGEAVLSELAYDAVARAVTIARATGGAFDPTLAPAGFTSVGLGGVSRRVVLEHGRTLDLGGLAKGLAVDRAIETLRPLARRGLVDIGTSSIALFGEEAVTFEVRDPLGGEPPASFQLRAGAVGSSSQEQWGDHITDPRTGEPVLRDQHLAVTVVADSALEADALATAVFVLGIESGLKLVSELGKEALVFVAEEGERTLWTSPGFAERYALEVAEGVAIRVSPES